MTTTDTSSIRMPQSQMVQFEVLKRIASDRVWELVKGRLLEGTYFFKNHKILPEFKKADVKLALMLVVFGWPDEFFSQDELQLLSRRQQKKAKTKSGC